MKYIEQIRYFFVWTDQVRFAQIVVFNIDTFARIAEIKNTFT